MRIALIGPAFPYKGGGAHHTTELAHRLAAQGHEVVLESWKAQYPSFLYPGQQTIAEPEGEPFPWTRHFLSWRRPDGWPALGRRLRTYDLVVLVVMSPVQVPAYLGILAGLHGLQGLRGRSGSRGRARAVALCHNVLPHEPAFYDRPLIGALLRRVDGVLVHSAQQAELARSLTSRPVTVAEMAAHLPVPGGAVVDGAVADGAVAGGAVEGGAVADDRAGTAHRLLFFGMVRPYKGLDVLLRALAAGPASVSLTVAGEFWGGLEETRALVEELGLSERVELRSGYVPASKVPSLFAEADALVLPYRSATASQNVWMAFEHGTPVIATRVGAFADQVRDGVDGLLCEPGDVVSLTRALELFSAPGEAVRLRQGVKRPDHEPVWAAYLEALTGAGR